jgi:uncharacterized protein (DUF58 family)
LQYTAVRRRGSESDLDPRVYASLDELVRLQFRAQGFSFLPRQPIHSVLYGQHASKLRGRGLNFEEVRIYLPGDDIRSVDWKVTARTQKPHVRVYTEERDRTVWLLIDQRLSMFFGSRERMKSVTAAEAAAIAAWRVLKMKDRVGAIVFDDEEIVTLRPQRSREQVMRILGAVVEKNHRLRADSRVRANPGMFDEALRRLAPLARHDCLICAISDATGAGEESRRLMSQINQHNDVMMALVYDPLEAELPVASEPLVVSDGVAQLELDAGKRSVREGIRRDFQERLAWLSELSRKHQMPLLPVSTASGVAEQVRASLGHRVRARRS